MVKKILRFTGMILLSLIVGVVLVLATRWGIIQYEQRQISGSLNFDLPSQTAVTGNFKINWEDNGRLTIIHTDNPDKILWQTVPGEPFIAAAQGEEKVTEAIGSFFIKDRLRLICADQTVTAVNQVDNNIIIDGTLHCSNGEKVGYTLNFIQLAPDQLHFSLIFENQQLNRAYLTYASNAAESFFGFGEQFSYFDLKGKRLPIFVSEQGVGRGEQPITAGADLTRSSGGKWYTSYAPVPHYITSQLRSLFLENSEYVVFDMRQDDRVQIQLFANEMNGRILNGDTPSDLITTYTDYAGRMRPLPDWIISGAIVGMQGGTTAVRDVWADLQRHDTPIAGFWLQDWQGQRTTSFGKQLWWNWEVDEERYPGWDALLADFAAQAIHTMVYVNPFLADVGEKPNYTRNLYQEAEALGYFVKNEAGETYVIQTVGFPVALLDLTNPAATTWMQSVITDNVIGAGASGWMADFGEALPYDAVLYSGESPVTYHNRYPEEWAKLNATAVANAPNAADLVFFSRAGYTRSPAYSTLFWLGDQMVSWDEHDGIKTAVTGLLSSGMSGYAFNHSDIGGYTTITSPIANYHRDKELLLRWMDLNAFTTIFRTHEGNIPDVNTQFYSDEETLAHFARMAKVYQAWGFYRQQLVEEAAATGLPVVRHPFIHYPDDPNVYTINYEQFMIGDQLMVAPVLDPDQTAVQVYLPNGRWVHIWSGNTYEGGQTITVASEIGETAVFYPEGSPIGEQFLANLQTANLLGQPDAQR